MTDSLASYLTGTAGLSILFAASIAVTVARPHVASDQRVLTRAASIAGITLAAQLLHFGEELATRFYERFPALLGLAPWSVRFFAVFNMTWLAVWVLAILGIRVRMVIALVPIWFLAFAAVLNGVAHPLLAVRAGGYFPGLLTAPLLGLAGIVLTSELLALTRIES